MAANPPTKTPAAPPAKPVQDKPVESKPVESKVDRFHPDMPSIPGVSQGSRQPGAGLIGPETQRLLLVAGMVAAVVLMGAIMFWRANGKARGTANSSPDSAGAEQAAPSPAPESTNSIAAPQEGPTVAATVDELSKPWDAKKFSFVNPLTRENIGAVVIRLPDGGLWAFSLRSTFSRCDLEYVTDLGRLASEFRFNARHPMVVSPCDGTVFDPLKVGPLGANTWARGEIVQGSALRPPLSIDVKVSGQSIIADSIEQ